MASNDYHTVIIQSQTKIISNQLLTSTQHPHHIAHSSYPHTHHHHTHPHHSNLPITLTSSHLQKQSLPLTTSQAPHNSLSQLDPTIQHLEIFTKFDTLLEQLGTKFKKKLQSLESSKLEQYKDDLIKTKSQFEELNLKRCDNAIKNDVYNKKKSLEKECMGFLERSMEISRVYEKLKARLVGMEAGVQELDHEREYVLKKMRFAQGKNAELKKQLKQMQQWYQKIRQKSSQIPQKNGISILGQQIQNKPLPPVPPPNSTQKPNSQPQSQPQLPHSSSQTHHLQTKIQNLTQLLNCLTFQQSTIEKMFAPYNLKEYDSDKKKLCLMEEMLGREEVKRGIYMLLFGLGE